ncbi:MAG: hypothetical protein GYB36_07850 [Alphaproteobacteria bacterium]|nr:hypothetical protein [Alphaproteobacteria bacterium]
MSPLLMDRALYIALNTGEEIGMRTHRVPPDGAGVRRNYGKVFRKLDFGRVASARTLDEVAEAFFRNARIILKHDGYHIPLAVFLRDNEILSIASAEFPNRGSKYLVIRELAHYALSLGATQCVIVSEAWAAEAAKMEPGEFPDTAEGRVEILSLVAADSDGQAFQLTAPMKRSLLNKKKVKKIGLTARNDLKGVSIVAPFQQLWGCLDVGAEPEEVIIGDGAASAAEPDPTP